jgi:hypothetical protein
MLDLRKFGGPEDASDEDVVKFIDGLLEKHASSTKGLADANAATTRELVELKTAAATTIALQAKVEALEDELKKRDESDRNKRMKELLDASQAAGKFKVADRPKWEKVFKSAGEATCSDLLKNAAVVVAIGERIGADGAEIESLDSKCDKIVREIMKRDTVTFDKAMSSAYREHPALFRKRDAKARVQNSREVTLGDAGEDEGDES